MTLETRRAADPSLDAAGAERAAFEAYLAPARGARGFWRVLATILFVFAMQFLALAAIGSVAAALGDHSLAALSHPRGQLIAALATLATAPIALALAMRFFHDRPLASVLGAGRRLHSAPFAIGGVAAIILAGAGLGLGAALGLIRIAPIEGYQPPWALLIAAILLIPAQAAGEEMVFRGYLLQELGSRWPLALVWAGAPAAAFALLHAGGGDTELEAAAYVASTFLFGLFAAALVWRSAGLSAAIGLHVVNNWVAICLFEPPQGVAGLGPLAIRFEEGGALLALIIDAVLLCAALAILWRVLPPAETPPQDDHNVGVRHG